MPVFINGVLSGFTSWIAQILLYIALNWLIHFFKIYESAYTAAALGLPLLAHVALTLAIGYAKLPQIRVSQHIRYWYYNLPGLLIAYTPCLLILWFMHEMANYD
ncbi:hypothetical protein [Cerasicoccus maritimus]|uniref:hypothetical protein n=1 Tax=Cerasicoccus maritimus TaxID=490089 RepID=UPI0028527F91|nr:hypothetical protein [Cerasicoccus maritimus]